MSDLVSWKTEALPSGEACFQIKMNAPRANALEPGFLAALHRAIDALEQSGAAKALLIGGRNFSSGGDVGRFHEAAKNSNAVSYAEQVVPALQALVMRIIKAPVIISSAVRGAVTGGASGLVFASDLVVAATDAFMKPYYGTVGFARDGGWMALLPKLIGGAAARDWINANHRHNAKTLQTMGLVHGIDDTPEARAVARLNDLDTNTARVTKALFWDRARCALVQQRLDAETDAFRHLISRPETLSKMRDFLQPHG
jgi:2-(1,2-epoxy-1,2-dihydrophenyl)acetyl-CoA isomerase